MLIFLHPLVLLASCTMAQSPSSASVPTCAQAAAFSSLTSTGCQLTDFPCICRDTSFLATLLPVVESSCSEEDFQKTVEFTQGLCKDAGVPITVGSSVSASASTSTSTATVGEEVTSTVVASVSASATGSVGVGNVTGTAGGNGTTSGNGTVQGSPSPSPQAGDGSGAGSLGKLVNLWGMVGASAIGLWIVGGW